MGERDREIPCAKVLTNQQKESTSQVIIAAALQMKTMGDEAKEMGGRYRCDVACAIFPLVSPSVAVHNCVIASTLAMGQKMSAVTKDLRVAFKNSCAGDCPNSAIWHWYCSYNNGSVRRNLSRFTVSDR